MASQGQKTESQESSNSLNESNVERVISVSAQKNRYLLLCQRLLLLKKPPTMKKRSSSLS
ncbi:hypothetical protein FRX31_019142 [Thalictrum thalictroides]|uniref:Uncharacterized protein n=1 Tax=Thalictrum thalictroides TaxID=46969 RepID=A0A7J6W264_THATH|nr:hypothetical protein FRX31_019142 [Thalictrum thalictroides]